MVSPKTIKSLTISIPSPNSCSDFRPKSTTTVISGVSTSTPFLNASSEDFISKASHESSNSTPNISTLLTTTPKSTLSKPDSGKTKSTTPNFSSVSPKSKHTYPPTKL
jgi:hypothetical protein